METEYNNWVASRKRIERENKIKGLFGIAVVVFLIWLVMHGFSYTGIFSANEGEHTGIVTAADEDAVLFFGTNYNVYFKTSEYSTQEDRYCVEDEALFKELQGYARNRTVITIRYKNDWFVHRSICNGGVGIIREVKRDAPKPEGGFGIDVIKGLKIADINITEDD